MYNEMSGLKNEQNSFSTSTSPSLALVLHACFLEILLIYFLMEIKQTKYHYNVGTAYNILCMCRKTVHFLDYM